MSTDNTLDVTQFESLAALQEEGQPSVLEELARLFHSEADALLVDAERGAERVDVGAVRSVAHSLKGMCGAIGATRMRGLAIDLEAAAVSSAPAAVTELVHSMRREFDQVVSRLAPYRGGVGLSAHAAKERT